MKDIIRTVTLTISVILSYTTLVAQDYSGRHYTDDSSSSSSGLGFVVILALIVGGFIIYGLVESRNNNKRTNNTHSSSSNSYRPHTIDDIRRQNAEYLNQQIEYLKRKDKEGDAALKGCIWALVTWGIIIIGHFLFN